MIKLVNFCQLTGKMKSKKILIKCLFFCALAVSCSERENIRNYTFSGMGTVLSVIYAGEKNDALEDLLRKDVELIEKELSYYKPESFVSILNRDAHLKEIVVPTHVCRLIETALEYGKMTDGVFDITYKSEGALWDEGKEPGEKELKEKIKLTGSEMVSVDCEKNTVIFKKDGVKIDLGGIAKGYAIDRAGEIIKKNGINSFIINYGGDMLVCGKKGKDPWKIGIKNPDDPSDHLKTLVFGETDCTGVATSGDYERFFVINNKKYSHIFDPRTGRPAIDAKSVTVTAQNALIADVAATAVSVAIKEDELIKKIMEKFKVKIYTLSGSDLKWVEH
ncbi:MAG TPA: FAD:protein FMN transferase [bacterium]|nr:FAD:protein FMN transferase [bacterium]